MTFLKNIGHCRRTNAFGVCMLAPVRRARPAPEPLPERCGFEQISIVLWASRARQPSWFSHPSWFSCWPLPPRLDRSPLRLPARRTAYSQRVPWNGLSAVGPENGGPAVLPALIVERNLNRRNVQSAVGPEDARRFLPALIVLSQNLWNDDYLISIPYTMDHLDLVVPQVNPGLVLTTRNAPDTSRVFTVRVHPRPRGQGDMGPFSLTVTSC